MKRTFTKIALSFSALFTLMAGQSNAATITATVSGNWSSAATWSGGTAGANISTDNIIIPAGITVTLDMDVQTSLLGTINVSGNLNSTNKTLTINAGALSGNGNMNLSYLEVGTLGGLSYTGSLTVKNFITSSASLSLGAQTTLVDTLCLKAGSLSLGAGSLLMLNTGSVIKVADGSLTISGGVFTNTNDYNVLYVGSSKTTGIELGGTGLKHLYVQLSAANQSLSLASNTTVNGTVYHNLGTLNLSGQYFILKGDYISTNNSMISGTTTSNLAILTNLPFTSPLRFNSGAQMLNNLSVTVLSLGNIDLGTDLAISGTCSFNGGQLNVINTSTLTMNAGSNITITRGGILLAGGSTFNGNASYNVNYQGLSKISGLEITGSGLNNVNLNLTNSTDSVRINANTIIKGTLALNKGSLNLNGHKLELKGNLSTTTSGWFQGNQSSELYINTTAGLADTINFSSTRNNLNNFSISTGNGTNAMLNSDLKVENLIFINGGVTIYDNDLTINATGAITGNDMNKYVMVKGTGSLMMNVNTSSPYVIFPVGTVTSYAPAHIQRNSGTNGMIGVGGHNGVWTMGTSGSDYATSASIVNRTWNISSVGTSTLDANLKLEWSTAMEVNSFNRNSAYISKYATSNWDMVTTSTSTITGTGTYQMMRTITSPGAFAVVDNLSALSVKELNAINFSLYPNPAQNHLVIMLNENETYSLEVIDALGNKAMTEKSIKGSSTNVDISSLSAGIYFVKLSNGNTQSIKKIVKQ